MKRSLAGKTSIPCNTLVAITKCNGDPEFVGLKGRITHPFRGLMIPGSQYIAGVWLTPESCKAVGYPEPRNEFNLVRGDKVEVLVDDEF